MPPGTRLPTEQTLSEKYGVARSTLRKALDRLRHQQLILSRQGDGNYIAGHSEDEPRLVRLGAKGTFDDVFEFRRLLDGLAAAHAATARIPALIQKMEDAQETFRSEVERAEIDVINVRSADIEFHAAIAEISPNCVLREVIDSFKPAVGPYWLVWMKYDSSKQRTLAKDTLNEHALILSAIKAGDAFIAETAMRRHFQTNQDRYRRLFGASPKSDTMTID